MPPSQHNRDSLIATKQLCLQFFSIYFLAGQKERFNQNKSITIPT